MPPFPIRYDLTVRPSEFIESVMKLRYRRQFTAFPKKRDLAAIGYGPFNLPNHLPVRNSVP